MSWFWAIVRKIQSPWIGFLIFSALITPASYFNGNGNNSWTSLITEWTYTTFNTHHYTERMVIALVHLHIFLCNKINCSENNIIRISNTYFTITKWLKNIYVPLNMNSCHTKTILKPKISFSVSVLSQS